MARITKSISKGFIPESLIASLQALIAMLATVSSALAYLLSMIPDRSLIHWSDESIRGAISSLLTILFGR